MTEVSSRAGNEMRIADPASARSGLRTAQNAAQRAGAYASSYAASDDARTAAAIDRLHRQLTSGASFNADAPPGYYLDITV